ncbi:uncharacterized protein LACBIDRAFT_318938 [Laccaria bicolor S238N-H82]|uniref:Predicted protein n=1 Tax=Laccaria bicolor (strain S238N-H82 / ATCC MYA-4686) TaxID=486041 RepID=B0D7H2_LACBS|nr:uncharacterized protein LACBIDRAFT_318938 [Laccaria bicolor S238N-H82]EDR09653.1 predicted protein [Laccaria bicolor S238N-H82]|eukprot:XP_001880002.1 predicted protein [Laccaria bicolor S238N-H82]
MFGQPFYNNPYQSAGYRYAPAQRAYPQTDPEWLRALADQRTRRRQWLPDEDDDSEEEWEYNQLRPQERLYLDARKRQEALERKEREERLARERALQELQAARRNQVLEEHTTRQGLKREGSTHSQRSNVQPTSRTTSPSPPPRTEYTERHHEAASRIQHQYRIHKSLRSIHDLESQFQTLKKNFVFPSSIDLHSSSHPDGVLTVPIEQSSSGTQNDVSSESDGDSDVRLAYTARNHALHAYTDSMDKLLMKLDGVESWGDANVRKRRRDIVKTIEKEASSVERKWMNAWKLYTNNRKE